MRPSHLSPRPVQAALAIAFVLASACSKRDAAQSAAGSDAAVAEGDRADGSADASVETADDEVRPVYDGDAAIAPDPLAARFCAAVHDVPETRRAACCGEKPGIILTAECVRTLSLALASKAVTLAPADVDRCAAAMDATYAGCDWPGPFLPPLPAACDGIVRGARTSGARCRSTLECAGTLRCIGVGPTALGRCGAPRASGERCGGSADTLAAHTRQSNVDSAHPECQGFCDRFKCAPFLAPGATCTQSAACSADHQCVAGKCVAMPPGALGEPCPGGACAPGLLCLHGACATRKPTGATCTADFECTGGCIRGTCARKCGTR